MRGLVLIVLLLGAGTAEARFGKSGSSARGGGSRSSSAASGNRGSSSSSGSGSSWRYSHGYLRRAPYRTPWWVAAPPAAATPALLEPDALRLTVNADFMAIVVAPEKGFTLGVTGLLEGEYFGFHLGAQNISVRALDGSGTMDNLQQVTARLTYAFLSGERGRLRGEAGVDLVFAADATFLGATVGFSGVVTLFGPFGLEASLMGTFFPFWQVDARAGVVVALGPLAVRAGWRSQLLDDRGLVDGVVHRDLFHGPTAGFSLVF